MPLALLSRNATCVRFMCSHFKQNGNSADDDKCVGLFMSLRKFALAFLFFSFFFFFFFFFNIC